MTPGGHREAPAHVRGHQEPEHPRRAGRPAGQADRRVHRPLHPHRGVRPPGGRRLRMELHHRTRAQNARCASSAGSRWACWSSPRCPASTRALGPLGPGDRRPAGQRRRRAVPVPLDAGVRAGGPPAVAARDGLGGTERREHGDDPPDRGGLRRLEAAHRRRRDARARRLLDLPAPGSRGSAGQHHGRRRRWAAGMPVRRTRSTTRPPSRWSTAPSKSSPRGTGSCSLPSARTLVLSSSSEQAPAAWIGLA